MTFMCNMWFMRTTHLKLQKRLLRYLSWSPFTFIVWKRTLTLRNKENHANVKRHEGGAFSFQADCPFNYMHFQETSSQNEPIVILLHNGDI